VIGFIFVIDVYGESIFIDQYTFNSTRENSFKIFNIFLSNFEIKCINTAATATATH